MHDQEVTESQLRWAIEQQQLVVDAADGKLRRAERILAQAKTERAALEAHTRADVALLDVEMAEDRLRQLQQAASAAAATHRKTGRPLSALPTQAPLFDVG